MNSAAHKLLDSEQMISVAGEERQRAAVQVRGQTSPFQDPSHPSQDRALRDSLPRIIIPPISNHVPPTFCWNLLVPQNRKDGMKLFGHFPPSPKLSQTHVHTPTVPLFSNVPFIVCLPHFFSYHTHAPHWVLNLRVGDTAVTCSQLEFPDTQ